MRDSGLGARGKFNLGYIIDSFNKYLLRTFSELGTASGGSDRTNE